MHHEQAAKLAKLIDELEADMRRMENCLYYVRCELEKAAGRKIGLHPSPLERVIRDEEVRT